MNKKSFFSIALCAGLVLPAMNFGAEQSWYDWAREGFTRGTQTMSQYMPQWENVSEWWAENFVNKLSDERKLALFGALVAALGLVGYAGYSAYNSPQGSKRVILANPDRTNLYAQSNLNNMAFILSEMEALANNNFTDFSNPLSDFKTYICPILVGIDQNTQIKFVEAVISHNNVRTLIPAQAQWYWGTFYWLLSQTCQQT